ncbi:helix-turn-helix domain-containing protein [Bacillus altitudinis]|uniref:helix-turn-helix domain-containing protein n=1 Tax=Bacillus altitudinis TaxID=293387 RepID=UPI003CFC84A0
MSFAEILRKAMDETNMTQAELSKLTGIGKSSISQYVSGKNEPNQNRKIKIFEVLGISPLEYIDEISLDSGRISVQKAAKLLGKSEQFVRVGLQRSVLPFGTAVKLSSKWTYHISAKKFYDYI